MIGVNSESDSSSSLSSPSSSNTTLSAATASTSNQSSCRPIKESTIEPAACLTSSTLSSVSTATTHANGSTCTTTTSISNNVYSSSAEPSESSRFSTPAFDRPASPTCTTFEFKRGLAAVIQTGWPSQSGTTTSISVSSPTLESSALASPTLASASWKGERLVDSDKRLEVLEGEKRQKVAMRGEDLERENRLPSGWSQGEPEANRIAGVEHLECGNKDKPGSILVELEPTVSKSDISKSLDIPPTFQL
ncbi:unnamed protein product [Protopolystoma xenopodis]|uniref:Uncharacterized protein n=1 Tax=Protopolystoma xenopodis TaxID=117903 RepID=A0A3S5BQ65_9PLAT|nr:unnamed protein product [Protopolystoma xenopodis]